MDPRWNPLILPNWSCYTFFYIALGSLRRYGIPISSTTAVGAAHHHCDLTTITTLTTVRHDPPSDLLLLPKGATYTLRSSLIYIFLVRPQRSESKHGVSVRFYCSDLTYPINRTQALTEQFFYIRIYFAIIFFFYGLRSQICHFIAWRDSEGRWRIPKKKANGSWIYCIYPEKFITVLEKGRLYVYLYFWYASFGGVGWIHRRTFMLDLQL